MVKTFMVKLSGHLRGEQGQALVIVLALLMIGSLTLPPVLSHISTTLKTGRVYDNKTDELYAADSGIEDAIWQIKYDRLNVLAKGSVLQGVNLQRFDVLWQIRQRFVEGVEPVREEGREWAKEVFMAIPFIGTLTSIGSAINAISSKVTPKLKGRFSTVGKWLQDRLGKNHVEKLLEDRCAQHEKAQGLFLYQYRRTGRRHRLYSCHPPLGAG